MMVKICGITNRDDAMAAAEAGAGAIGLNFYRESPRYVSVTGAAMIVDRLPEGVLKVGLFVDETADAVARIMLRAGLDVAQLHGISDCEGFQVWRAVRIQDELEPLDFTDEIANVYVLDTASDKLLGGTGKTFRWELARQAKAMTDKPIVIAGGLDETNVQTAIAEAMPWGVDACSRLETEPGRKDRQRMKRFIEAALAAGL